MQNRLHIVNRLAFVCPQFLHARVCFSSKYILFKQRLHDGQKRVIGESFDGHRNEQNSQNFHRDSNNFDGVSFEQTPITVQHLFLQRRTEQLHLAVGMRPPRMIVSMCNDHIESSNFCACVNAMFSQRLSPSLFPPCLVFLFCFARTNRRGIGKRIPFPS